MIVKNYSEMLIAKRFIESQPVLAYDVETTGLNTRKDKIIGFGVSNASQAYYFLHLSWDGTKLIQHLSIEQIQSVLNLLKAKKLIGFNSAFDVPFTTNYFKVDLLDNLWSDAMLAKHTTDEEFPFGLKELARREFGESAVAEQTDLMADLELKGAGKNELFKARYDIIGKYCMQDCRLTYRLNTIYLDRMRKEQLEDFFLKDEVMPLYRLVTIPMEQRGILLDMDLLTKTQTEIIVDIQKLEESIKSELAPHLEIFTKWFMNKDYPPKRSGGFAQAAATYLGADLPKTASGAPSLAAKAIAALPDDSRFKQWFGATIRLDDSEILEIQKVMHGADSPLNLQSKFHLKKIFFDTFKEQPLSTTETGLPQLDDEFLESVKHKYSFVQSLLDYNKLNKIKSTYVDRFLEEQESGRFYPRFLQHATTSGRFGSNLQQLPRIREDEDVRPLVQEYNNRIRRFFVSDAGHSFVGSDYASLEVVVFADDAGDEPLVNMIKNKYDFYSQAAIDVWKLDQYSADKKSPEFLKSHLPEKRQSAKEFALGLRYGMGSYKLSKVLEIPESEAKDIIKKYFTSYPKLKDRMNELTQSAKFNGYVRSKAGRVRHLPELKKLYSAYGNIFDDGLKLYEKYSDNSAKYEQMKYLKSKFHAMVNNALNFPIQSMAASIVNRSSIEISKAFKEQNIDAYICMNVHDEINVLCKDHDIEKVKCILQDKMENTVKLSVPLTAEPEVAKVYAELK